jgi:hypothetical protein
MSSKEKQKEQYHGVAESYLSKQEEQQCWTRNNKKRSNVKHVEQGATREIGVSNTWSKEQQEKHEHRPKKKEGVTRRVVMSIKEHRPKSSNVKQRP